MKSFLLLICLFIIGVGNSYAQKEGSASPPVLKFRTNLIKIKTTEAAGEYIKNNNTIIVVDMKQNEFRIIKGERTNVYKIIDTQSVEVEEKMKDIIMYAYSFTVIDGESKMCLAKLTTFVKQKVGWDLGLNFVYPDKTMIYTADYLE